MNGAAPHYAALALCIVLVTAAQVLLKLGARRGAVRLRGLLNGYTGTGYGLYAVNTVLAVYAMQRIDLKVCSTWMALTYLLVVLAARGFLREPLSPRKIVGCGLILLGVGVFQWL